MSTSAPRPPPSRRRTLGIVAFIAALIVAATIIAVTAVDTQSKCCSPIVLPDGTKEYVYPTSDMNTSIPAKTGETFIIQLQSTGGDGGHLWVISESSGITYINTTTVLSSVNGSVAGVPVAYNFFFKAMKAGSQSITLKDVRPFGAYPALATINVQVAVS